MKNLKSFAIIFIMSLSWCDGVWAEDKKADKKIDSDVKELSGISIIGNKEAPKSLYIVPWKDSEVGVQSSLKSGLLDETMRPVDKEVFMRELNYYQISHGKP